MKGLINQYGSLCIERKGVMKYQYCPNKSLNVEIEMIDAACGDYCPHFGEPETINPNETRIEICHGKVLKFTELEDKRTYQKEATGGNS